MTLYLENIVSRLKQFSDSLDRKELFVDIPWVVQDDVNGYQKYIFRRNGQLIMSKNGEAIVGKWEYIPTVQSLLLDRIQDSILLNQIFVDKTVMILNMDGMISKNVILANSNIIDYSNVLLYLKNVYYIKFKITLFPLKSGIKLEVSDYQGFSQGNLVSIDGQIPEDGTYISEDLKKKYVIRNGKFIMMLVNDYYNSDKGPLLIEHIENLKPIVGDLVFKDDKPAPDGVYRLGFLKKIFVRDGVIIKKVVF